MFACTKINKSRMEGGREGVGVGGNLGQIWTVLSLRATKNVSTIELRAATRLRVANSQLTNCPRGPMNMHSRTGRRAGASEMTATVRGASERDRTGFRFSSRNGTTRGPDNTWPANRTKRQYAAETSWSHRLCESPSRSRARHCAGCVCYARLRSNRALNLRVLALKLRLIDAKYKGRIKRFGWRSFGAFVFMWMCG